MSANVPLAGHRIDVDDDGRPVLVKTASTPEGCVRLAIEAATLELLAHPGTVQVLAHEVGPDSAALHVRWVGPHSLATVAAVPVAAAARVTAEVTSIVADLHATGLAHRRLTADHVLISAEGRPVLTGFADAVASVRASPSDDVRALGEMVVELVAGSSGHDLLIPDRRRTRGRRDDGLRAALLTLADQARSDVPGARPSAAALAAALTALIEPTGTRRRRAA